MNFDLSEEQSALQDSVGRLLHNELEQTRLLGIFDSEDGHDVRLWQALGRLGVLGLMIDEQHGGTGLRMLDAAVVAEILGYHGTPGPYLGHVAAALAISMGGNDVQKERWLPRLATGDCLGTVALAESDAAWQPDEWELAGQAALNGAKRNVLYPRQADLMVVGVAGGELMLVENPAQAIEVTPLPCLDATRRIAHVAFRDTPAVPLGGSARRLRDALLVLLAADAFGGARRCIDMAVDYALTREQFGQVIGAFQGLKHQLANVAADIEPARGLYWYAAHAFDAVPDDAERMAALAKAHIAERFLHAARETTQAHGGIAYTWEFPLHVWLKRAVFDRAYMGSTGVHRARVADLSGWARAV